MFLVMKIKPIYLLITFFLGLSLSLAYGQDCAVCGKLGGEVETLKTDQATATEFLAQNRKALTLLGANDVSKRIKVTSNILILSARVETMGNNLQIKDQEFQKMRCQSCPKI